MRRIDAGMEAVRQSGSPAADPSALGGDWPAILRAMLGDTVLRPVQAQALLQERMLETRQNLVVCAPTNAGKSLVGHVAMIEALRRGQRALMLAPLRALAQEQADTLSDIMRRLVPVAFAHAPRVRISTGDYRLEGEMAADAPPEEGEAIVATPERMEAILRNPANAAWAGTIGTVVIDEAHLLGDASRGPTLELLVATMLGWPVPPRLVLISATIGEPERLRDWLAPCRLISSSARTPLAREIWALEAGDDVDTVLLDGVHEALATRENAALVFVYRREAADALARRLERELGIPVPAYHSGRSATDRATIRECYRAGTLRCLVATTALAMGVNLPATHVFLRDTTFHGVGDLRSDEILQIVGRAGRGDRRGQGVVMLRPSDGWEPETLAVALRAGTVAPLRSAFEGRDASGVTRSRGRTRADSPPPLAAATLVASCLARAGDDGMASEELSRLLGRTLGARALVPQITQALAFLSDPARALAYRDEQGRIHLTVLGTGATRATLPLPHAAGLGQLVRDLVSLDVDGRLLARWTALDHLLVVALASERAPKLRRFSEDLVARIDAWHETRPSPEKSLLFAEWVTGAAGGSKADELLGSLGIAGDRAGEPSRRFAYGAMLAAILLDERSRGTPAPDIEARWGLSPIDGIEESWRDTALWLLAGHAQVLELRGFYHHLRENCAASPEQLRAIKRALGAMRGHAHDLLERLKFCSPLGPLVRGIRATGLAAGAARIVGVGTIRQLESAGIRTMQQLAGMEVEALVAAGVQRRFASQIRAYMRRRLR